MRAEFERLAALETDECVMWTLNNSRGWGWVAIGGRMASVKVVALERHVPRPPGMEVTHDLPEVPGEGMCINWRHLRWWTRKERMKQVQRKARLPGVDNQKEVGLSEPESPPKEQPGLQVNRFSVP